MDVFENFCDLNGFVGGKLFKGLQGTVISTWNLKKNIFSDCSCIFLINLQEQVKKAFCYQKLFWPFTVWINCSSDLKTFANSPPSVSNFKSLSLSLEQFFLTVGQNNFGNKIVPLFKLSVLLNWLKLVYGPCTILIPYPI